MKWFTRPRLDFWYFLGLSIILGVIAGALGTILVWSRVLPSNLNLPVPLPFATVTDHGKAVLSEDELLNTIREEIGLSLVDFFAAKSDPLARYFPGEALGHGLVLTSDGWIVSHRSVFDPKRALSVRAGVGSAIAPFESVVEDQETGLLFMKISTTNLRPVAFRDERTLESGMAVYAIDTNNHIWVNRIDELFVRPELVTSSDRLEATATFEERAPAPFVGSPVVDRLARVIGLAIGDDSEVGSTHFISSVSIIRTMRLVFESGAIARPMLGISGIHLAGSRRERDRRERGFLVTGDSGRGIRAVESRSPAARAGIKADDVIVKIHDTVLTEATDFAETLLASKPGDTVDLTVMRQGIELIIPVTLGSRESGKRY